MANTPESDTQLASYFPVKLVGKHLPAGSSGMRLHRKVAIRWCTIGVRGVRLRYIAAGRQKLTCDAWLFEFCDAVARAQQPAPPRPPSKRRDDSRRRRTTKILADVGLGR